MVLSGAVAVSPSYNSVRADVRSRWLISEHLPELVDPHAGPLAIAGMLLPPLT